MGLTTWRPTSKQEEFLSLPDSIFEALFGGQAGGGKSEVLLNLPLTREFYSAPRFKGLILRRTLPELEREIILRSQSDGLYKACGGDYQDQKKRWKFPSGAIVQFGHLEHETDVKIYDTAEYNYIGWDEVTSFTPYMYEYLTFSRCRTSDENLPTIVRSGTNPGGVSHNYFRKRFVEPFREGGKLIKEFRTINSRTTETKLIFIKSRATDNDYLMKSDPGYLDRMQRLPEAERIAKAEGDWWIYSGQVFEDFRETKLSSEASNALHVIPSFQIPYFWPKVLSIDWGYSAMTHAIFSAINPLPSEAFPAKVYIYKEYAAKKEKISLWASNLKVMAYGEDLRDVVLDPSAFGIRGDEKTIAEQFADSFGREARRADNDRIGGKLLVQEYLRWKYNEKRQLPTGRYDHDVALRIRRTHGEEGLREYERTFLLDEDEGFLPKLQIFDTCKELINCLPLCIYNKNKVEDVEEFDGDDPYDNLRYNLKACQNLLVTGTSSALQEEQRVQVLNALAKTQNMTAFYMNMNNLESKERRSNQPISRRRYGSRRRYA
jgi:hypothetical protein